MTTTQTLSESANGSDPTEVVRKFFGSWTQSKAVALASFDEFFTPETIWENVGVATTVGIEEARAFTRDNPPDFETMVAEIRLISVTGRFVFTERIDDFFDASGNLIMSARGAGVAEIVGGRIVSMREYFVAANTGA